MYICPNCNNASETAINFCSKCGTPMVEKVEAPVAQPVQEPAQPAYQEPAQPAYQEPVQPAYEAPVQEPVQPAYQQPAQPTYQQPVQPVYQQPVYQEQPVYYQTVENAPQPSLGKAIAGMIMGIAGLGEAVVAFLYTLIFLANGDGEAAFAYAFFMFLIGFPICLVGLILSNKAADSGVTAAFPKVGKITGLIGVILCAFTMFLGFVSLGA